MALAPYRNAACESDDIHGFMYETAEKGIMVAYGNVAGTNTEYTGTGMAGDSRNVVVVPTATTQQPFGLLATDVIDVDLSRHCFWDSNFRDATTPCNPVKCYRKGIFRTDKVDPAALATIAAGDPLYWVVGGLFTNVQPGTQVSVGTFEGTPSADGFVVIRLNMA